MVTNPGYGQAKCMYQASISDLSVCLHSRTIRMLVSPIHMIDIYVSVSVCVCAYVWLYMNVCVYVCLMISGGDGGIGLSR